MGNNAKTVKKTRNGDAQVLGDMTASPLSLLQAVTHVAVGQIAEELRSHLQSVIDEVGNATEFAGAS